MKGNVFYRILKVLPRMDYAIISYASNLIMLDVYNNWYVNQLY